MDLLPSRIDIVNAACSASACDVDCATVLFPLLDDCRSLLNGLYDSIDGVTDGEYHPLSDAYDECSKIPITQILDTLKTLQERGQCPSTILDGVASKGIKAAQCADVWQHAKCGLTIKSGLMTCERDFCHTAPTPEAPCLMAGQCDSTCGFCDDSEGHRRLLALRRLQMAHIQCDPTTFSQQAKLVDHACCGEHDACEGGNPTHCDAECAVVFNSFYDRCQRFLSSQFGPDEMSMYVRLYQTCTTLPVLPLLEAVVQCSSSPPDPCYDIDCGQHGVCDGGMCQCEEGYSGEGCDVFDLCVGVDCREHGDCVGGSCQCEGGYSGDHCENHRCCSQLSDAYGLGHYGVSCPYNDGLPDQCMCGGGCCCCPTPDYYNDCDSRDRGWDNDCDRTC